MFEDIKITWSDTWPKIERGLRLRDSVMFPRKWARSQFLTRLLSSTNLPRALSLQQMLRQQGQILQAAWEPRQKNRLTDSSFLVDED